MPMYHKILVPLDGSELAEKALPHALMLADKGEGQLILVRAVPLPDYLVTGAEVPLHGPLDDETQRVWRGQAERYLEEVRARPELVGRLAGTRVVIGNAADEILDYALECGADLIVVCSHGRTGLRRFLLGSVAEKLVRHSPCPVMVVAAEHDARKEATHV